MLTLQKKRDSRRGTWRNIRANRHHPRGFNRRWLDGESNSEPAQDDEDQRSSARKWIDMGLSCRRVPIIQDWFWLLLWHGPFKDIGTETKANMDTETKVPRKD